MFELSLGAKWSLALSFPITNEKNKPEVESKKKTNAELSFEGKYMPLVTFLFSI